MTRALLVFLAAIYSVSPMTIAWSAQNASATQGSDSASQANGQTSPTAPSPGRKVWTNDDVSGLRKDEFSTASPAPAVSTQVKAPASKRNAAWYRDQILQLQAKIPPLDAQIADLRSALEGKPTGDGKKSVRPYSVRSDDWAVQLAQVSQKRDDILEKISTLRDAARHNGIAPNTLP
jgi:hypothetical protein